MTGERRASQLCWLGLFCFALSGCGKGTAELHGTVTYQDKPVRTGSVVVVGTDGVPRSTTINDDGSYSVTGIPIGPVKVAVNSPNPTEQKIAVRKKGDSAPMMSDSKWVAIPEKYADFNQSELTFLMKKKDNVFNIELK